MGNDEPASKRKTCYYREGDEKVGLKKNSIMGLTVSHGCWDGGYHSFNTWREAVAHAAGLPPLCLMEGFYANDYTRPWFGLLSFGRHDESSVHSVVRLEEKLPIKWDCLKPTPLAVLLHHSDCEGTIPCGICGDIADALEAVIPKMPEGDEGGHIGNWRDTTAEFVAGLRQAWRANEDVVFR